MLSLKLIDEKAENYKLLMSKLKHLVDLTLTVPEEGVPIELSELLQLGILANSHETLRKLKMSAVKLNGELNLIDDKKLETLRLRSSDSSVSTLQYFE